MPEEEAEIWTGWGIHVFKDGEDEADCEQRGNVLEEYLDEAFDKAEADPGEDFFSALTKAEYQGRKLTRDEMMGFGNLTFAGGRDTIIHSISCVIAYLAKHPEAFDYLRESPKNIVAASEEFFRVVTPLTHIGRTCPVTTDVHGFEVKPKGRVSLCWSSANNDETVFEDPHDIQLDRKPNPHVAFGFGKHLCLGAPHARLIIRTLLQKLCDCGVSLTIEEEVEHVEREAEYTRVNGYDVLRVAVS
jgi:cytochrome P450